MGRLRASTAEGRGPSEPRHSADYADPQKTNSRTLDTASAGVHKWNTSPTRRCDLPARSTWDDTWRKCPACSDGARGILQPNLAGRDLKRRTLRIRANRNRRGKTRNTHRNPGMDSVLESWPKKSPRFKIVKRGLGLIQVFNLENLRVENHAHAGHGGGKVIRGEHQQVRIQLGSRNDVPDESWLEI